MKRPLCCAASALIVLALACSSTPARNAVAIDHLIIGVANLEDGIAAFEKATGVSPLRGGKHPSGGTENALVSLGRGAYLEIIAPRADADPNDEFARYLRTLATPTLVGWMLRAPSADVTRSQLQQNGFSVSEPKPGSRVTPAGEKLEWRTFSLEGMKISTAPFFIEWGATTTHPSLSSPGGCTIRHFALADPKAADLSRLLAALNVDFPVKAAERPHMDLTIQCGAREAAFVSQ